MSTVGRREILKQLGVGTILLPSQMTIIEGEVNQDPHVGQRRIAAIGGVRLINTIQVNHFALNRRYLPLRDLGQTPVLHRVGRHPLLAGGVPPSWEDAIPGFRLTVTLSPDSQWYAVEARDEEAARYFAYRSDAQGLIIRAHEILDATSGHATVRTEAFAKKPRQIRTRLAAFAITLLNALVPTVYAQVHSLCCKNCGDQQCWGTSCNTMCPIPGGAECCNLGYVDCLWCCAGPTENCECAWDECPPLVE